jgi:hypothetical protein
MPFEECGAIMLFADVSAKLSTESKGFCKKVKVAKDEHAVKNCTKLIKRPRIPAKQRLKEWV